MLRALQAIREPALADCVLTVFIVLHPLSSSFGVLNKGRLTEHPLDFLMLRVLLSGPCPVSSTLGKHNKEGK
jgi:hypothetical protein